MIITVVCAALLAAEVPPTVPDVAGWTRSADRDLDVRADDWTRIYLGQVVQYADSQDPGRYVLVYYRHFAVTSHRAPLRNDGKSEQPDSDLRHHESQQKEELERVRKDAEPFAYIAGRTERDARLGQDMQSGTRACWLLGPDGSWAYESVCTLTEVPVSELSWEPKPGPPHLVGREFRLGDVRHVLRADPTALMQPTESKGGGK